MTVRITKIIALGLIAIFSIVIISLFCLPQPILRYALVQAGFASAQFEHAAFDLQGLHVTQLQLDDTGTNKIEKLDISITPRSLLQRRLEHLHISNAVLDLTSPVFATDKSNKKEENGLTLPSLPVNNIDIQNINTTLPTTIGAVSIVINGHGSAQDKMEVDFTAKLRDAAEGDAAGKAEINFKDSVAKLTLEKASFKTPQLDIAEGSGSFDITLSPQTSIQGQASLRQVSIRLDEHAVTVPINLDLNIAPTETNPDEISINGRISGGNGIIDMRISGRHAVKNGNGSLTLDMPPANFVSGVYQLSDAFPIIKTYADEVTGSIGARASANWTIKDDHLDYNTKGTLFLKDVSATVEDMPIQGINAVLNFQSLYPPVMEKQKIAIGSLQAGLPLTNGVLQISLDKDTNMTLHNASWDLAKGKVASTGFTVSPTKLSAKATLTATGLDLSELFRIAPMDGLSAFGLVNGVLPLVMTDGKLAIVDGILETGGNGKISYDPTDPPAFLKDESNAGIVNLRNALKNFNYDALKITVNGELGGQQALKLAISGKNPDFYDGHAVNLNLNVEGPLENVLRYNPGSNNIPDSIREQIESYENEHAKK